MKNKMKIKKKVANIMNCAIRSLNARYSHPNYKALRAYDEGASLPRVFKKGSSEKLPHVALSLNPNRYFRNL